MDCSCMGSCFTTHASLPLPSHTSQYFFFSVCVLHLVLSRLYSNSKAMICYTPLCKNTWMRRRKGDIKLLCVTKKSHDGLALPAAAAVLVWPSEFPASAWLHHSYPQYTANCHLFHQRHLLTSACRSAYSL